MRLLHTCVYGHTQDDSLRCASRTRAIAKEAVLVRDSDDVSRYVVPNGCGSMERWGRGQFLQLCLFSDLRPTHPPTCTHISGLQPCPPPPLL